MIALFETIGNKRCVSFSPIIQTTAKPCCYNIFNGQTLGLFVYFRSFKHKCNRKNCRFSTGFELGLSEQTASTLTT